MSLAVLAVLTVQLVSESVIVSRAWWWLDDFIDVKIAQTGTYADHPMTAVFGHLTPGQRYLLQWAQSAVGGHTGAVVGTVLFSCLVTLAMARFLWLVLGDVPRTILALLPVALTPLATPTATWWCNAAVVIPCELGVVLAIDGFVRRTRTGRWLWHLETAFGFLLAAAFFEKALLILPLLGAAVLWFDSPPSWRSSIPALLRRWRPLAGAGLLSALYLVVYFHGDYGNERVPTSLANLTHYVAANDWHVVLPALWGLPGTGGPNGAGTPVALLAFVATCALVYLTCRDRPGAARAWLLVALACTSEALMAGYGRLGLVGLKVAVADSTYVSEDAFLVSIGLAAVLSRPRLLRPPGHPPTSGTATPRRVWQGRSRELLARPARRRALVAGAVLAYAIVGVHSQATVASLRPSRATHDYQQRLLASLHASHGHVALYDTMVPGWAESAVFYPYTTLSSALAIDGLSNVAPIRGATVGGSDVSSAQGVVALDDGKVVPAHVAAQGTSPVGMKPVCSQKRAGARLFVPMPTTIGPPAFGTRWFAQLTVSSDRAVSVSVNERTPGGDQPATGGPRKTRLRAGVQVVTVGLQPNPVVGISVDVRTGVLVCVSRATVGPAVP